MVGINLEARIRERAYQIWEREGHPQGKHLEHWRRAEQEVKSQAKQGDLERSVEGSGPAPRMHPASAAAAEAAGAKEAKRAVKRKQTQSEAKAPRTRRPKTTGPKSTS